MPLITVSMFPGRTPEQKAALVAGLTNVVVQTCAARREDVWVTVTEVDRGSWAIGGRLYSEPTGGAAPSPAPAAS